MTFDSIDVVFYTSIFLLPGFLVYSLIGLTNPIKKKESGDLLLSYLGYSLICLASFSPFYYWILPNKNNWGGGYWLVLLVIIIAISTVVGLILSKIQASDWLRKISIFRLKIIDPVPTAWDKIFSDKTSRWLRIYLKDGSSVTGLFSTKSFCSAFYEGPDIYLERIYDSDADGEFKPIDRSQGIYIKSEEIRYIEFFEW